MINYPVGHRDVNEKFVEFETRKIDKLNDLFFKNVELTEDEQRVLVWLCGWDDFTINNMISVFKKVAK